MIDSDVIVEVLRDKYFAHTTKNTSKSDWQLQEEHLMNVSKLCEYYANEIGMGTEGAVAGLLHDLGKYSEKFQSRLEDNTIVGINHWSNGAYLALTLNYQCAAIAIQGHHTGIPNAADFGKLMAHHYKKPLLYEKLMGFKEPHDSIVNKFCKRGMKLPKENKIGNNYTFSLSVKIRMLFSCLVDADRTDTSKFCNKDKLKDEFPKLQPDKALDILLEWVKNKSLNSNLGNLRTQVLNDCLTGAELPPGIFTLTVPTGGAKTIASIAFGLKHSIKYNKKKIIYVLPFTTIIDQTGLVLTDKDLNFNKHFGDDYVLEHHSSVEVDNKLTEKYKVATSRWENPMIVTTTVQFFESLFSNKTSSCVKLHNIPNSVIIFDEVQTLPTKLLKSLLTMVQVLVKEYNCTVLFCSATVPAFESVKLDVPWTPIELCSNPNGLSDILKRVTIKLNHQTKISHSDFASKISQHNQCLAVVNSKRDCIGVYDELIKLVDKTHCFHLSTNMCSSHRKKVIAEIRQRVSDKKPCLVVSTQLIEAGVDVDFPYGYRIFGPLDSIVQVAGRINREGKLTDINGIPIKGTLEVIGLIDSRNPKGSYNICVAMTESFLNENPNVDLHSPNTYREYFKRMYSCVGNKNENLFIASKNLQFEEIQNQCRIIQEGTVSVITSYEDGQSYIDLIQQNKEVPKWLYRKLQSVSVNIYESSLNKFIEDGVIDIVTCGDANIYYWKGTYSDSIGVVNEILDDF